MLKIFNALLFNYTCYTTSVLYSAKICYNHHFRINYKSRPENYGVEMATELLSEPLLHLLDIMVFHAMVISKVCFPQGFCHLHE